VKTALVKSPARRLAACLGAILLAAGTAGAQPRLVSVRGVAWDSLRSEPLVGAMISLSGTTRSVAADSRGRFVLDSVAPGTYTALMSHDAIDSVGLPGVTRQINVTDGRDEVRLALPSFATFWSAGCPGRAPRDSSLVYGVVRTPGTGAPIRAAKVELAWLELDTRNKRDVQQRLRRMEVTSDSLGNFGFCGVPAESGFRMRAAADRASSGILDMMPSTAKVRWRDLSIGLPVAEGGARGVVAGTVVRGTGTPFADARVVIDDVGEARTDSVGRFVIAGVPTGTRQLQILAVGADPIIRTVDVAPGDSTRVHVNLDRITRLGSVRVSATPFTARVVAGISERRAQGLGRFADSSNFVGMGPWVKTALQSIPFLTVRDSGGQGISRPRDAQTIRMRNGCVPSLYLDGTFQPVYDIVWSLNTDELGVIEMYASRAEMPTEFQSLQRSNCALVIWTKRALRDR
jgi:hypothetical protein